MARPLTGWRIARINRQALTVAGTAESSQLDFNLAVNQGIEIATVLFGVTVEENAPTTLNDAQAFFSLHAENGALETVLDGPPAEDALNLDSEVIAQSVLNIHTGDAVDRTGVGFTWAPGPVHNLMQWMGVPYLLAINPTFRVVINNTAAPLGIAECAVWYRYVLLRGAELGELLARRR